MRPPIPYFGGKQMLAERIISAFPPHEHYVEPFCGSLAVLLAKQPSRYETVNDLDGDLMTFWRVLRDRPADLERACALTPHSRAEHEACLDLSAVDDLERARRVWVRLSQGRSAKRLRKGWRYVADPAGRIASMATYLDGYIGRIGPAAERLRSVTLESRPALEIIADFGQHEGVLLYVDPPYLGSTRPQSRSTYAVEMESDDEHRELAEALVRCKAAVVLSGYPSPLYDDLYAGWQRTDFDVTSTQGMEGAARSEVLWCNREAAGMDLLDLLADGAA